MKINPAWRLIALFVLGIAVLAALFDTDWTGPRPLGDFAEIIVSMLLTVLQLALLVPAIWIGARVARKTKQEWLGWVIGIIVFFALGLGYRVITGKIPGVGWRMDQSGVGYNDY